MRILSFILIISLSKLTTAQNIFTKFSDTTVYDNFESNKFNFPQKYNALEISIIENGMYRIKRLDQTGRSISYLKQDKPLISYEVSSEMTMSGGKKGTASIGLILNGQTETNGGVLVEFNNKGKFRVIKMFGEQLRMLSGSAHDEGWIKSKNLNKKGTNRITVKVENGYYDIYFNGLYTYTAYDTDYSQGKVGIFANGGAELLVSNFLLMKSGSSSILPVKSDAKPNNPSASTDPEFQEVILIFKTKIDQQQKELKTIQRELDQCRSMLNYDTTLVTRSSELEYNNKRLAFKLDSTSKELTKAKKRLEYLESLKEDIEKGSNGDLVLNLTSILSDVKNENTKIKNESTALKSANAELKKDNEVLLREIKRLKYMLDLKE